MDTPTVVTHRYDVYNKDTLSSTDYLKTKNKYYDINASNSIEKVVQDAITAINNFRQSSSNGQ